MMQRKLILSLVYGCRTLFGMTDVVITGKHRKAVFLHYWGRKNIVFKWEKAPHVIWKGNGEQADKMIKRAVRYDIPIIHHTSLARCLYTTNNGERINRKFYSPCAKIYASLEKRPVFPWAMDYLKSNLSHDA